MAKTRQIGFRIPEDEYQRIMRVFERAKERTMGYAPLGDVVRELIGTSKPRLIEEAYLGRLMDSGREDIKLRFLRVDGEWAYFEVVRAKPPKLRLVK